MSMVVTRPIHPGDEAEANSFHTFLHQTEQYVLLCLPSGTFMSNGTRLLKQIQASMIEWGQFQWLDKILMRHEIEDAIKQFHVNIDLCLSILQVNLPPILLGPSVIDND